MALRALLFSSDGSATAALCDILTDLSMEAEICSELLVAVERVSHESYDAILVDWDQETDAVFLLKTCREQKGLQALNLALTQQDKDVGRALQQGANSVIRKPINPRQAQDTLSTARDLILSRRAEQKDKEARREAAHADLPTAEAKEVQEDLPVAKTGFLSQTSPRSAFDVQASQAEHPENATADHGGWQAARGPEAIREDVAQIHEVRAPEVIKREEPPRVAQVEKQEEPAHEPSFATEHSEDTSGVFSDLPDDEPSEEQTDAKPRPHSQRLGFVLVACSLIAGVLYVWAPGDSYGGRLASLRSLFASNKNASAPSSPVASTTADTASQNSAVSPADKADDPPADPGPLVTTDVDPSKIQIIETKAIPKAGAQVPTSTDPNLGVEQGPAQPDLPATASGTSAGNSPPALSSMQESAPVQETPKTSVQLPTPLPQPRLSVQIAAPAGGLSSSDGRSGVVIPDSLRATPSPAQPNSIDPFAVPEETSRGWIVNRVEPDYPAQALQQHLDGSVVLQAWVGKDGTIQDLKLMKGYFVLGRAAFAAVRQWKFKPYAPSGKPVEFQTSITITFEYPK